ncbi:MAG TPA: PilN domain-containing protein [Terriglobia bacterium]|nr:PilN domain-containing protein [Terriglobia bacterium]
MTKIRINLLAVAAREVEEAPSEPASPAAFVVQTLVAGLMVSALLVAAAYWVFNRRLDRINQQMEAERREAARLSVIQAANSRYSTELQDINRRIDVLQLLEAGRRSPEQLMTQLAGMVNGAPELFLMSVTPQGGRITLSGVSNSVTSIATFVRSFQTGDGFGDVQLREYYEDDEKDGRVSYKFSLEFSYVAPTTTRTAAAAPAVVNQSAPAVRPSRGS